jgi:two-component system chemotaxis sensor kinase CheA
MPTREEEFLQRLMATFKVEAEEHVSAISAGLIELEKSPPEDLRRQIVETVFREAHSLKGAARSVNLTDVELLCQAMEGLMSSVKREEVLLSTGVCDLLFKGVDTVNRLLADEPMSPDDRGAMLDLREGFSAAARGEALQAPAPASQAPTPGPAASEGCAAPPPTAAAPAKAPATIDPPNPPEKRKREPERDPCPVAPHHPNPTAHGTETIRIPRQKLDSLLLQVEELIAVKLIARQHLSDLRELRSQVEQWSEGWDRMIPLLRKVTAPNPSMPGRDRNELSGIEEAIHGLCDWHQPRMKAGIARLSVLKKSFSDDSRTIDMMIDTLLEDMKEILMFPCSSLLDIFPKMVRDIAKEEGKEIDFRVRGGEIEIDNRILQELKDPLLHLIRNCIGHGIESPQERSRKRKDPRGKLAIAVSQTDSGKVEIQVVDDGGGIDPERVKSVALAKSIVTNEEVARMEEREALSLIFRSGFSTAPIITTLSGRGLGLAIVREKIEKLGGTVAVESHTDAGTMFRLLIPLTLATFRGTLVRLGERVFAIPTLNVDRVVCLQKGTVRTVENTETVELDGKVVPLVRLAAVLELAEEAREEEAKTIHVLVLGSADARIAFQVDEVMNEEEVIVKNLGRQLSRVRNIAGATVLGTGKVVLVLNVADLLKSATTSAKKPAIVANVPGKKTRKKKSILVVEDSITARTLLKNILESAGYGVVTAVDGVEGFTALQSRPFDLVVSDVQMPRMNGLELTGKIRATKEFATLPVVLVTGLESQEDKRQGVSAGANAYIVKSSFDQGNLLSAIRRMI